MPPLADLPQHLSQIVLAQWVLDGSAPELMITPWYFPNTLVYLPMLAFWKLGGPTLAGPLTLSLLIAACIFATYSLCRVRQRPIAGWLLSLPLIFNFTLYWGLLNFVIGWPIFCLFVWVASEPLTIRRTITLAFIALLLYYSHSLWFLAGTAWLFLILLERPGQQWRRAAVGLALPWCFSLVWYPQLAIRRDNSGVETSEAWFKFPHERLDGSYLPDSILGGLPGSIETAILTLMVLWIAASLFQHRRHLETRTDKPLLLAALLLMMAYWTLPDVYMNTIFFNRRWLPFAVMLLVYSLPAPSFGMLTPRGTIVLGSTTFAIFVATTTHAWHQHEIEELSGLAEAISTLRPRERLLGLDAGRGSAYVKGAPTLHAFAYAQVFNEANLSFSFAEHYSGIVQYRGKHAISWNKKLLWQPARAKMEDLAAFDAIIINGEPSQHEFLARRLGLIVVTGTKGTAWRLYHPRNRETSAAVRSQ